MLSKRLFFGGLWAVSARGAGVVAGFVVNALLARLLAPEEMGTYFLSVSVAAFLSIVGQAGMPVALVRFVAEALGRGEPGRARAAALKAIFAVVVFGAVVSALFVLGVGEWVARSLFDSRLMEDAVPWVAVLVFLIALQGVLSEVFRGFHDIRLASWLGGVSTSIFSALAFLALWLAEGRGSLTTALMLSAGAAVLSIALSTALLVPRLRRLQGEGTISFDVLINTGWPLGVSSLAVMLATQGDLWVVGAMLGEREAAIYGVALRLLAVMTMMHGLVVSVVQSSVAELYGQGRMQKLEQLVQGASFIACCVAGVLLLALALFGKALIGMVFGASYIDAYVCLMILGIGQFVGMLFGMAGMVMMMSGHQHAMMRIILLNTVLGMMLAVAVAPYWGVNGVAGAWAFASVLQGAAAWLYVRKRLFVSCHAGWGRSMNILRLSA